MDNRYFDSQVDEPTVKLAGMLTPEDVFSIKFGRLCPHTESEKHYSYIHRRQLNMEVATCSHRLQALSIVSLACTLM